MSLCTLIYAHFFSLIVPGTSASDLHFQAYLLEGLSRWNADRSAAAVSDVTTGPETYSGALANAANDLSTSVIGKKIQPGLQEVAQES